MKTTFALKFLGIIFVSAGYFSPVILAQADGNPPTAQTMTDQAWANLQVARQPHPNADDYLGKSEAERKLVRRAEAQRFIGLADQLRKFVEDYPEAEQAKEAKRLEALNLIYATQAGEHSQDGRWKKLVNELRRDAAIPSRDRYQLTVMASHAEIDRKRNLSPTERLNAYRSAALSLVMEFPQEPAAYEALLGIARNSPNERALALCEQILAGPADASTKLSAQALAGRLALVGVELAAVLEPTGVQIKLQKGQPVVIYSWATWSEGSQVRAEELEGKTARATLVGLCLDTDVAAAKGIATSRKLPGEQIYDDLGVDGSLAQALHLGDAGWIYLVNAEGVIVDIRAQENIEQLSQR